MKFQKYGEFVNEANVVTYTDTFADLTLTVLQVQAQNKLLHWGTLSYAEHKTLDGFKDEFNDISDTLIESIMGKFGRPITGGSALEVLDYNQVDIYSYFQHLYDYFTASIDLFQPKDQNEEIVNILAEIIGLIDQTKYLLTLTENELLEYLSNLNENANNEDSRVLNFLKRIAKDFDYPVEHAANFVKASIKRLGY
jgi:hypothetical protein